VSGETETKDDRLNERRKTGAEEKNSKANQKLAKKM
jgi:hypothetical protein